MNTPAVFPVIEELRERIRRLEGTAGRRRLVLLFGIKELDRHLSGGGLALGALHEVAGGGHGAINGAAAALFAAGIAARTRGLASQGRICSPRLSRKPGSCPIA